MLTLHLRQIEAIERGVADLETHIEKTLVPFRAATSLLITMPGLSTTTASVIVAEIGTDMAKFPTAGHLVSWAGLCPRLDESTGKRRSTRTRPSAMWLKPTLVQAAWAATRKKVSYFHAQYLRLQVRVTVSRRPTASSPSALRFPHVILRHRTADRSARSARLFRHRAGSASSSCTGNESEPRE